MTVMRGESIKVFLEIDGVLTQVLTVKQASYRYNCPSRTIQQWIDEGKLIAHQIEQRWFIPLDAFETRIATRDYYHSVMGQFE